jgi:hypothetical protein
MRRLLVGLIVGGLAFPVLAAEGPRVEAYLHSGDLARGEQVLEAALLANPDDDELRFGLGDGCRSENTNAPFLRLPVPPNPDPSTISYSAFCRVLNQFGHDLARAEGTLAGIKSDDVTLRLRLADVRLDLMGRGQAAEKFVDLLTRLMARNPPVLAGNPSFEVCFDRGDVAWLRAYCHLLMAMIDMQLALDLEPTFNLTADELFLRPHQPFVGTKEERSEKLFEAWGEVAVREPARLPRFRQHLLQVCELNRETWKHIRAETDDDHEWLPNSRQKGVLGLPVNDTMIDVWLGMIDEVEAVLTGRKVIPRSMLQFISPSAKRGLNLQAVFDDPPATFDWNRLRSESPAEKYLATNQPDMNFVALFRVAGVFQNSLGVAYAAWFN